MKIKFKMKRALLIVIGAAMLTGCNDSSSGKSESSKQEFDASKYDSYITYHIDDQISDADFEKIGGADGQLLERFKKCFSSGGSELPTIGCQIQSNTQDRT